ncbi:MAG: redox-regulated ATPase YchF [Dehalococcoidales bacterium]|nr:MAG: redox-regulated ATPase YchF [Dehalococcoidales bacterium]
MNIEIGIIGLPQSGRTTFFNALARGEADTVKHAQAGAAHVGVASFADPRLDTLTDILKPNKTIPITVSYVDIGASVKGLVEGKGIAGQLLTQLSKVDALINVVREFQNDSIPHSEGSLDVARDIAAMNLEMAFSDLAIIERRMGRIEESLKGAKPAERQPFLREEEVLAKVKAGLEEEVPIREQTLTGEETRAISNFRFLTAKPLLIVVNIGEDRLPEAETLEAELNATYARPKCRVVTLCGKLEMELSQLDSETAATWQAEFGLTESGFIRIIRVSYELLGLVSFFTIASSEVRAWPVPGRTVAPVAAGKIHSDMERGFIRAEVISFDDLVKCGSLAEARKRGLLRTEGKAYIVQDGDVITFLFNV